MGVGERGVGDGGFSLLPWGISVIGECFFVLEGGYIEGYYELGELAPTSYKKVCHLIESCLDVLANLRPRSR